MGLSKDFLNPKLPGGKPDRDLAKLRKKVAWAYERMTQIEKAEPGDVRIAVAWYTQAGAERREAEATMDAWPQRRRSLAKDAAVKLSEGLDAAISAGLASSDSATRSVAQSIERRRNRYRPG